VGVAAPGADADHDRRVIQEIVEAVRAVVAAFGAEGLHAIGDQVVVARMMSAAQGRHRWVSVPSVCSVTAELLVRKKGHREQVGA
jgi:hypothetical protein